VDKRFTIFMVVAVAIVIVNQLVVSWLFPPDPAAKKILPPPAKVAKAEPGAAKPDEIKPADAKPDETQAEPPTADAPADKKPEADQPADAVAASAAPQKWISLGSADADSPYRMLVTLNSRGAAVERIELSSPRYRDLENRSGYLGHLAPGDAPEKGGALVRVVGPGTPAAAAGLQVDDVITALDKQKVSSAVALIDALEQTEPGQSIQLTVKREGEPKELTAKLDREPLSVIRPEFDSQRVDVLRPDNHDPLSFLMTIQQYDERTLDDGDQELGGVNLRGAPWEIIESTQNVASFRRTLPALGLQVVKTYRLEKVPQDQLADTDFPAYSLAFEVAISNVGDKAHQVAYRLDGPTGLPIEGAWYANKVSRTWGSAGLRDIVVRFEGGSIDQIGPAQLADPDYKKNWANASLDYIAVDAQYSAAALLPVKYTITDIWFANVKPTRVGAVPADKNNVKLLDVSFRLDSIIAELQPGGKPLKHRFQIFAGPKKPNLLAQYGPPNATLNDLIYYGWFGVVARPMLAILHAFHLLVGNYGIAIIMLTVLVRGCMFPLSRKQALSAQKMQELQPEIKRLNEKYKSEPEKKTKAQQELFRQHNYNPLGGCLLAFVQLPIFVGLYRSLMVDVELRQAPLFGDSIRWASNLAAPDMFWNWSAVVPDFISHGTGFFGLGPYLNILPLLTIALFIWQQKMFMPPPADEQAALQQKMMQYMMIFMGIMFFKVASGLCVYFIASSIWGIAERKLLPKANPAGTGALPSTSAASSTNGAAASKKRQKGRK